MADDGWTDPTQQMWIDGEVFKTDGMDLGEENVYRHILWQLAPGNDIEQAGVGDLIAAGIVIHKRRTKADFPLEEALKYKREDVLKKPSPPTKPRSRAK